MKSAFLVFVLILFSGTFCVSAQDVQNPSVVELFVEEAVLQPRGAGVSCWVWNAWRIREELSESRARLGILEEEWEIIRKTSFSWVFTPSSGREAKRDLDLYQQLGQHGAMKLAPFYLSKEGLAACARPMLAEHLGLSVAQQLKIEDINRETFDDFIAPYGRFRFTCSDPCLRVNAALVAREYSQEIDRKILSILNADQKKRLEPLLSDLIIHQNRDLRRALQITSPLPIILGVVGYYENFGTVSMSLGISTPMHYVLMTRRQLLKKLKASRGVRWNGEEVSMGVKITATSVTGRGIDIRRHWNAFGRYFR